MGVLTAMAQSETQANTDPLTGLLNRRSLESRTRAVSRDTTVTVMFADLDHFKQLNDTFGHDMGDRALRLFAQTLQRAFPEPALVARHGGEEFVVVIPDCTVASAAGGFERVRQQLAVALADGRVAPFTVSAGLADTANDATATLDELIGVADGWLLDAKNTGRDKASWGPAMDNVVTLPPTPLRIS
jgi:diguanylate cyclase (GGDEF)-like protein